MKNQAIHFVGLDVHQSTTVASVRDESGKVVMSATVPTTEKTIVALLRSWPRVQVAFEEGTQAQWLHDVLVDQVERVVVCNLRGKGALANKDDRIDRIDADHLSEQLRLGGFKAVFHGAPEMSPLRELVRNYNNLVEDSTRVMLRIKRSFELERSPRPGGSYGVTPPADGTHGFDRIAGDVRDCRFGIVVAMDNRELEESESRVGKRDRLSQEAMKAEFPGAVPEIPVSDIDTALEYYDRRLGFSIDWGDHGGGGIAGISKGNCRIFLTNAAFREHYGNTGPVLIWLNLDSKQAVDALHEVWRGNQAKIISAPESKPWGLHEFTAADLDGNLLRVFYDFATPEREENR